MTDKNSRYQHGANGPTETDGIFLGFYERQFILPANSDTPFTISPEYEFNPGLIANKFYGKPSLKWVILLRNNILNPFTELTVGTVIMIPSKTRLQSEILT